TKYIVLSPYPEERAERRWRYMREYQRNHWQSIKYESTIRECPTYVCGCCGGLFFQKDISSV
ncbi:hypothetical protein CLU79DRAFT_770744, partial [Phycomyces nitens]